MATDEKSVSVDPFQRDRPAPPKKGLSRLETFREELLEFREEMFDDDHLGAVKKQLLEMPKERLAILRAHLAEEIDRKTPAIHHLTKADMASQHQQVVSLPILVRIVGVVFGLLAVICTWEALDHIVIFFFPNGKLQIVAQCVLLMVGLICLWISKKLTDIEWPELGTFGFTLSSLMAAAASWGLVVAIVRLYVWKSNRLAVWTIGSAAMLTLSLIYTLLTKHNALIDIASCATSLGYLDDADEQDKVKIGSPRHQGYGACA